MNIKKEEAEVSKLPNSYIETEEHDKDLYLGLLGEDDIYLDSKQACKFLSVTKGALYNMVYCKQLKRINLGNRNRYRLSDLKKLFG